MSPDNKLKCIESNFLFNDTSRSAYWISEIYEVAGEYVVAVAHGKLPFRQTCNPRSVKTFQSKAAALSYVNSITNKKLNGDYVRGQNQTAAPRIKPKLVLSELSANQSPAAPPRPTVAVAVDRQDLAAISFV